LQEIKAKFGGGRIFDTGPFSRDYGSSSVHLDTSMTCTSGLSQARWNWHPIPYHSRRGYIGNWSCSTSAQRHNHRGTSGL